MRLNIVKTKEQPLLSRKEIIAEIDFDGVTPSRKDITTDIAKKTGSKEELIVVKNIYSAFGFRRAESAIYIYDDKAKMEKYELKHALERGKAKKDVSTPKDKASGAKEVPVKKEEKPAETSLEEPKEENKEEGR